jgi:hypothetical protein
MPQLHRRTVLMSMPALALTACETLDPALIEGVLGGGPLTEADAARGIRAALDQGVGTALSGLGRRDGFFGNPEVKIPLPDVLQSARTYLAPIGAAGILDELQEQLNRGAEQAVPEAASIFLTAVRQLTIQDAINIVRGPDTAATDYLRDRTTDNLVTLFSPIMSSALEKTGALRLVSDVEGQLPLGLLGGFGFDPKADLIAHGVKFGLAGVFDFIAREEKAIRQDPAARTSAILRRVFG